MASSAIFMLAVAMANQPTLAQFEAALAAHDSATQALGEWCAARGMAHPAIIRAEHVRKAESPDPPERMRKLLAIKDGERMAMRHVHLVCGDKTLSVAWNWFVPARLTPEMNTALAETNVPFGKVVAPLGFRREALSIVAGPAENCPADTISTHRARLILPDGKVLAYLIECYTPAILGQ